jgi:hypothetical protein
MPRTKKFVLPFNLYPDNAFERKKFKLFDHIKNNRTFSLSHISRTSSFSAGNVRKYAEEWQKKGLCVYNESEKGDLTLVFEPDILFIGVGFTEDKCIISTVDNLLEVRGVQEIAIPPLSSFRGRKKEVTEILERVRKSIILDRSDAQYCGVAVPRQVISADPKLPGYLVGGLSRIINCNTFFCQSTAAAAYAERELLRGPVSPEALYMYSDKGSGVVIKEGAVITSKESEKLETAFYLREWDHLSIVETARKLVSKGIGTIIVDKAGTDVGNIDLDAVLRSAEENDELAMDLVKRSALALGVRAAYLMNVFGIRVMILGGGLQKIEGNYAGFLSESVKRFTLKEIAEKLDIKPGELADKADSIGAAALCRRESFTEVKI